MTSHMHGSLAAAKDSGRYTRRRYPGVLAGAAMACIALFWPDLSCAQIVTDGSMGAGNTMPSANLFLINPKGVLLGRDAKLNVGGAVHASTADYIRFADNARYWAD